MRGFEKMKPLAVLLLRLGLGFIFLMHGYPKLQHLQQTVANMPKMGFPTWVGYIAAILETFGGFLLIVGFLTRIVGLLFAIEMVLVIWRVHFHSFMQINDYQFPLAMCVGSFALAAIGAGLLSLDYAIFRDKA